ncbi:MAG: hypothetical protein K2I47_00640 [Odoribacter sp.]|nr:hypothetical protein [Odoribacter sp.]
MVTTGTPPIRYIWTHNGDTIANGNSNMLTITNAQVDTAGEYVCHIQNGCGDDITKTAIMVSHADTFRFVGGGHYCVGDGGLSAELLGSDTSTLYRLYKNGVSVPLQEIHGRDVVPMRGHIVFENLTAGTYYVTGTNRHNCEDRMPGEAKIIEDPLPEDYRLYVERHMCGGDSTGNLALPGSQSGVLYYLLKDKPDGWDTLQPSYAGTGNPLLMVVGIGFYKMYAVDTATGCARVLSGLDSITPRPYPQECELGVWNDDSLYCRGSQSDVILTYECFENGSSYTLWKNGQLMNPPKNSEPLSWTGVEEGIYNIRVMNKWGCSRDFGRQEVKIQELPQRFPLIGARIYCKNEPGSHRLDLQNSEEGVKYSFRYLPSVFVKDTLGTGGEIKLDVPLAEHKYYVIATDTTPEHCSVPMLDTVEVRMSGLSVEPDPAVIYVEYGQVAQLNMVIQHAEGTPVVQWTDPNGYLADSLYVQNPTTKPCTWNSEIFQVEVTDASGCKVVTSVKVVRKGGKLEGEIRKEDCLTSVDTVMVCEGNDVELCAYAAGGQGYFVYTWSDLNNTNLGHGDKLTYTPSAEGYVWLDIQSGQQSIRDSVYIVMGTTPRIDTLELLYSRCVTPGTPEQIVLKNSESGNSYSLEYSADGLTYNYVSLTPAYGSDGKITFSLLNAAQFQGYLRIVADRISSDGKMTCRAVMDQTVEIRVAPTKYDIKGGWNYCGNDVVRDTIVVDGAQEGVTYCLKKLPGMDVAAVTVQPGQDSVLFAGRYTAGDYMVVAEIGACRDTMNGVVKIIADTLPPIGTLENQGVHCAMACPVEIAITQAIPGVDYYLVLDSLNGGRSSSNFRTSSAGRLSFGSYCELGHYSVKAVNPVTACENEKAKVLLIRETPDIQHLTGDTLYCEGDFGVKLALDSTENGVIYYVQKWEIDTACADSSKWMNMTPAVVIHGNGFPINISSYFTDGLYRLMSSEPCPAIMDSIRIRMIPLPKNTLKLQLEGNGCIDSAFVLKIDPMESDVNYTLRFNGTPVAETPVATASGTGIEWHFANGNAGNYSVFAEREMCSTVLEDSVRVDSLPQIWPLDGVKQLCQNDKGTLFMPLSEPGVKYSLYDTAAYAFTVQGTIRHDSVIFNGVKPGAYYPQAARGNCFVNGGLYTINALPAPVPVQMEAADCIEAGTGWIKLSGLQDGLEYVIQGMSPSPMTLQHFTGDTTFGNLAVGIYCVTVKDTLIGCESLSVCDTIREGVGTDSIIGDFYYCEDKYGNADGVSLTLSGTRVGIDYSVLDKEGNVLMTTRRPNRVFPDNLLHDTFIFRKERPGYLGGCRVDSVFEVKEIPLPADSLKVELTGGSVLCAGGQYYVNVHESQKDKWYILRKQGSTVGLDTVMGQEGMTVTFPKSLTEAGRYEIYVRDVRKDCGVYLDTLITIAPQPQPVVIDSCFYCYDYSDVPGSDSCRIGLRGMLTGTIYRLNNGVDLDTLEGPGNGLFGNLSAGNYKIIAENSKTGCIDTMETSIRAVRRPQVLDVVVDCGVQGVLDTIYTYHLSEVDKDSVVYYLYKDGVRQIVSQVGDGMKPVTFGHLTHSGVYKIYAEKRNSLCGVFMNDSIVITPPMNCKDTLQVIGEVCQGSGDTVALRYNCSVAGWKYYLRSELCDIDTIAGGRPLMWSVGEGRYILRAYNECGTVVNLDTVDIIGKPSPAVFAILNKNFSLCEGKTFEIILSGSEEGVVYTVVDGSGRIRASITGSTGGGVLSLGMFGAAGQYAVWAEKGGCKKLMDKVIVAPALLPADIQVLGSDKCLADGALDSIQLCLASRENNVSYYLYVNGRTVLDSLTFSRPGELCFNKQESIGRYTVVAVHPTSKCRKEMPGVYNMSTPAVVYDVENPGEIIHICQGTDTCLYLENSEVGIEYFLKRNGVTLGSPAHTSTGGRLKVACVSQSGEYQAIGRVGECETLMNDTVVVEVHPLPYLDVEKELHYCEFSTGVDVTVAYPTDSTVLYELYSPNGVISLDARYGNGDHTEFTFSVQADSVGYYKVMATDTAAGCSEVKRIQVVEDKLPLDYDLISSNGKYLCADGSGTGTYFSLSGSEKGVTYTLYRLSPREDIVSRDGTGGEFRFPKEVRDTGLYIVRAENLLSGCENSFSPVRILRADTVRRYDVISVVNRYCSLSNDPDKGIIQLSSSQLGVEYEIYRNGVSIGMQQMGTGGPLQWKGLEGELCRHLGYPPRGGMVYAVMARDTLTNCMKQMNGTDTIVAEERIEVLAQEPNEDIAVCEKDSVQFSVTTSGCGEHYQWYHNGAALSGETKSYYNIRSLNLISDPGYYYCNISNTCGMAETQMVKLTIYPLVSVKKKMEPVIICNPQQKSVLLASAFANAQYFVWYRAEETEEDWLSLKSTYEIVDFDTTKVGKYVCKAWNGNHCNVVYDTCEVKMGGVPEVTILTGGDTLLCNGLSSYIMEVYPGTGVSIEWEFNGQLTGDTGSLYTLYPVTTADEGLYAVRAQNKCGTAAINVGRVLVDDSIKIMAMSENIMLRCSEEYETLFLTTEPAQRVSYHWYQMPNVSTVVSSESSFRVGPMGTASPLNFRVVYSNKCSAGEKDFVIHVPQKIETDPLPRMISACADCMTDTVLRLNVDASMFAQFKWFYRISEQDTNRISIESDSDSLAIPLCSSGTGYYYCKVYNRCETDFTTETSWIRIDTVPVINNRLPAVDSVCEGLSYVNTLSATGGGLKYTWVIKKKDGTEQEIVNRNEAFASTSELNIRNIGIEYDSCRIICYVENHCGKDTSNMMLLRVLPMPQVVISPAVQMICARDTAMFEVELFAGVAPWEYKIEWPDRSLHTVSGIQQIKDTMKTYQSGKYSITYLKDVSGCIRTQDLPVAELQYNDPAKLTMSGSRDVCMDDSVALHFSIVGGVGPWKIKVVDILRGALADEICGSDALVMSGRDTVLYLTAHDSAEYSLNSIVDLGTGCNLSIQDSNVVINVRVPDHISFIQGPWYVGQCNNVNLRTYLQPRLNSGSLLPSGTGHFFINGVDRGTNSLWLKEDLRGDSCYRVKCEYRDSVGCLVTSDEIRVCVDSLPSGAIISTSFACQSVASDLEIQLRPSGRIDTLVIYQHRYKKWPVLDAAEQPQVLSFNRTQIPSDGLFKYRLNWGEVGGVDSCLVYEILELRDIHGCRMDYNHPLHNSLYRDTIWRHADPVVDVQVRRSSDKPWINGTHSLNLSEGDSVQVKVSLLKGEPLWSLPTLGIDSIEGLDTVFWLRDTGTYLFAPQDVVCGRFGPSPYYDLTLRRLDTGYFRGKVLLEGVFDEHNMLLAWGSNCHWSRLRDSLGLPSSASLPNLPSGLDVIDWIEVELRISNGAPLDSVAVLADASYFVTRDTCLVLSDGHLADRLTGDTLVGILGGYEVGSANQRYVVLRHRNHLGVMTNRLYGFVNSLNKMNAAYIDFTVGNNIYHKGSPLHDLNYHMTKKSRGGKDFWLLAVGSLDANYLVSLSDPNRVTLKDITPSSTPGQSQGYRYDLLHDINLDGCVDWPGWNGTAQTDWLFVERNRTKYTEIRWDR